MMPLGVRNSTRLRRIPPLTAPIMILHGRFAESLWWSDKQESDNSQSRVRLGLNFSPFMFNRPFLFLLSHLAWPSSRILSILSEKIALYWNRLVHTEIINADPNCANSSSSIALITRLFTEALKKPLNCHSQQLKNIYGDKDWEKGIGGLLIPAKGDRMALFSS